MQDVQEVDSGDDAKYLLPYFTITNIACPVTTFEVLTIDGTPNSELVSSFGDSTFRPRDPLLNKDYRFKIKAVATGGAFVISDEKSLLVGCTSSMTITKPENFSSIRVLIGSSPKKIFKIQPLVTSRSYCKVIQNIVVKNSIVVNGK
jgi:hypothetical protein